jgi:hypothetical protein
MKKIGEKLKRGGSNKKAADLALAFVHKLKPEEVSALSRITPAWEKAVGPKLAPLAVVQDFQRGELLVLVKSSTLYTMFVQYEKSRLLELLRRDFPQVKNIVFKMG